MEDLHFLDVGRWPYGTAEGVGVAEGGGFGTAAADAFVTTRGI